MQKAILNIKELNIKQMMNEKYSHDGDLAIDLSKSCKYVKAPFDLVIKRLYKPCNAVFCESLEKVLFADGTKDYMSLLLIHDNDISDLKEGMIKKQNDKLCEPGNKGFSTGTHTHIAIGKGKYQKWIKGKYQPKVKTYAWILPNQYPINKGLFLAPGVKQVKPIYKWVQLKEEKNKNVYAKKCDSKINSLVDGLISVGVDYSFKYRCELAKINNINSNYRGRSADNIKLLNLLKKGLLRLK